MGYTEDVLANVAANLPVSLPLGLENAVGVALDAFANVYISDNSTHVYKIQTGPSALGTLNLGQSTTGIETVYIDAGASSGNTAGTLTASTQGGSTGLDYSGSSSCALTTGNTCTVSFSFAPGNPGPRYGAVTLTANADSTQTPIAMLFLAGTGTAPLLALTPGVISTTVGTGLSAPRGLVVDGDGNQYIADAGLNHIMEVSAGSGAMQVIAETGHAGFNGDGGDATQIQLNVPSGLALDGEGNLYIADTENNLVRKLIVDLRDGSTGLIKKSHIQTIAGGGGGLLGDGGAVTLATLGEPLAVALDGGGNLYIADPDHNRVPKVTLATGVITTVAGNGSSGSTGDGGPATAAEVASPTGVAVNADGNLYIASSDGNYNAVRKVATTGIISTVAGTGPAGYAGDGGSATAARLNLPSGLFTDPADDLYLVDGGSHRVRTIDAASGLIRTIAGTGAYGYTGDGGAATLAALGLSGTPSSVALDANGNLFIADQGNGLIRRVAARVTTLGFAATPVGILSSNSPQTVTVSNAGNAALTFPTTGTGNNPSLSANFTLGSGSTCPQLSSNSAAATLAAGASCTALLSFLPSQAGSISGSLRFTDDSLNVVGATQAVTLTGTATKGSLAVTVPAQSVAFTASTVVITASIGYSGVAPTGAVMISLGSNDGTGRCVAGGGSTLTCSATFGISYTRPGSDGITVSIAGDADYNGAKGTGTPTITKAMPTIAVPAHSVAFTCKQRGDHGQYRLQWRHSDGRSDDLAGIKRWHRSLRGE